jgi:hypothetical protein
VQKFYISSDRYRRHTAHMGFFEPVAAGRGRRLKQRPRFVNGGITRNRALNAVFGHRRTNQESWTYFEFACIFRTKNCSLSTFAGTATSKKPTIISS